MASTPKRGEDRGEARFPILNEHPCQVKVERRGNNGIEVLDGELIDLSRGGAKLLVSAPFQFSEIVRLRIIIPQVDLQIDVTSEVCWARLDGKSTWLVGFSFRPNLSEDMLQQLAVHSIVERRHSPRITVRSEATVSLQSNDKTFDVTLRDISTGGFCMMCKDTIPLGEMILLHFPVSSTPFDSITATVRWEMTSDHLHLIGCSLQSADDYMTLRQAVCGEDVLKEEPPEAEGKLSSLSKAGLGLMVLMMVGALGLSLLKLSDDSMTDEAYPGSLLDSSRPRRWDRPDDRGRLTKATTIPATQRDLQQTGEKANNTRAAKWEDLEHRQNNNIRDANAIAPLAAARDDLLVEDSDPFDDDDVDPFQDDGHYAPMATPDPLAIAEIQRRSTKSPPVRDVPKVPDRKRNLLLADDHSVQIGRRRPTTSVDNVSPSSDTTTRSVIRMVDPALTSRETLRRDPTIANRANGSVADSIRHRARSTLTVLKSPFRDAYKSNDAVRASQAVNRGDSAYRTGRYKDAFRAFQVAIRSDAENPLHHYLLAMAQYQLGEYDEASKSVDAGITFERFRPIRKWGETWMRYQGPARIWLEEQRNNR